MKKLSSIYIFIFLAIASKGQGLTLFNDNFIHEVRFELVDTSIFINSEDYQSVKMIFDGNTVTNVGLKKKGNISASHANNKVPFKIKTNKYVSGQEYDGIREFTLNNSFQDPSMMREKMTYDIADEMGLYSLRTAYAKVYIDNHYWGVYTIVEGKDEMFKHVFNNNDGDAIESTDYGNMCYYGANRSDYQHPSVGDRYIVDNGDETTAWSRLITMLDKANNTSTANYYNTVGGYLNISHFARYQALNVYLLNFDSYIGFVGNQLYYYDETAGLWQVIPWDFNASFGLWNTSNFNPISYPIMPADITNGCVASFINTVPTLKNFYLNTMCEMVTYYGDTANLNQTIDNWKAQIQSAVYTDWRKEFTNSDFNNGTAYGYYVHNNEIVPAMKSFVRDRQLTITQELSNLNYSCATSSSEPSSLEEFNVHPNPASSFINIHLPQSLEGENLEIFNLSGLKIREELNMSQDHVVDTSDWTSGVYVFKIGQLIKKVVIVN